MPPNHRLPSLHAALEGALCDYILATSLMTGLLLIVTGRMRFAERGDWCTGGPVPGKSRSWLPGSLAGLIASASHGQIIRTRVWMRACTETSM